MIRIVQTPDQMVYFTSDWHLGHQRDFVWGARGYKDYEDHTNNIIDVTNGIVRPNDIIYYMGDFCLNTPMSRFEEYLGRIQCQNIRMVWGNHNNPHFKNVYIPCVKSFLGQLYFEGVEVYPLKYRNVTFLGGYYEVAINGQMLCLFHYPISVFNQMNHAAWHLCGHSHYHFDPSTAENTTAKILDVGWDGFKKPLSFAEVSAIMAKKQVPVVDHHGE